MLIMIQVYFENDKAKENNTAVSGLPHNPRIGDLQAKYFIGNFLEILGIQPTFFKRFSVHFDHKTFFVKIKLACLSTVLFLQP